MTRDAFDAWKESIVALVRTLAENQSISPAEVFVKGLASTLRGGAKYFPERFGPAVAAIDALVKMLPADEGEFMGWARCSMDDNTAPSDSQAAPGQPIPKEMETEEPKPMEE